MFFQSCIFYIPYFFNLSALLDVAVVANNCELKNRNIDIKWLICLQAILIYVHHKHSKSAASLEYYICIYNRSFS